MRNPLATLRLLAGLVPWRLLAALALAAFAWAVIYVVSMIAMVVWLLYGPGAG